MFYKFQNRKFEIFGILLHGATAAEAFKEFTRRFGNIFQFWLGPSRLIIVGGTGDVQHIYTHRHIYEQGDAFVKKFGILIPNAIINIKGSTFKRHASLTMPLFRHTHELAQSSTSTVQRKRTSLIASLVCSLQQDEQAEIKKIEDKKKGLSRSELLDEMLFFLIVGSESVSSALSWFIYHMSKHPQVQQKIKAELMDGDDYKGPLSLDRLDSLVYLDAVINEVLRFTPISDGTFRTLTVDDRLPESGVQLYKGDQVYISIHNLAQDPQNWSIDPEIFYPERFLKGGKPLHPYAFIPFGSGHRQCIGQDLARFEFKVIAARLMQYVTFHDGGPQVNTGGQVQTITIMPKHIGVSITFD
ncbi:unnamed protein product [Rotaria sordida]|uniref:Cytochrome P450 n=2 Tax=Rotaria sordida TaxID=392033 RepID=A0A814DEK2_9BILA|nr:unnamed protein product [Rotaria sordida]CAF1081017.1 unnamed protein product [Rotaria sordida]